jgi:hypothetical protein
VVREAAAAAFLLAVSACASPSPEVTVSVYQTRSDMPLDKIEIQVHNVTSEPVTVERAQLRSDRFVTETSWNEPVEIPAGAAVDLKVQMPAASCLPDPRDQVVVSVRTDDGTQDLTLVPEDPLGQLDKYSAARCFERDVASTATLNVEGLRGDRLQVVVDPGQARIGAMGTTILFRPRNPGALRAPAGSEADMRQVVLRPNRCDAHALAEDKQGTYFPVSVTLPDGRSGDYTMTVDQQTRVGLYRLFAKQCGLS